MIMMRCINLVGQSTTERPEDTRWNMPMALKVDIDTFIQQLDRQEVMALIFGLVDLLLLWQPEVKVQIFSGINLMALKLKEPDGTT